MILRVGLDWTEAPFGHRSFKKASPHALRNGALSGLHPEVGGLGREDFFSQPHECAIAPVTMWNHDQRRNR